MTQTIPLNYNHLCVLIELKEFCYTVDSSMDLRLCKCLADLLSYGLVKLDGKVYILADEAHTIIKFLEYEFARLVTIFKS